MASKPEPAIVDFTKYRTDGLVARMIEVISVPSALLKVFRSTLLLIALAAIACFAINYYSQMNRIPLLIICAYLLIAAVVFGFLHGILRVIATALGNVESILRMTLEITRDVAEDYEQLQTGTARLPSGGELFEQVYGGVVLPTLERAVASAFGFLSKPLLWAYRRTVGSAVRFLIIRVHRARMTEDQEQQIAEEVEAKMGAVAKYSDRIEAFTTQAAEVITNIGGTVRFYAMLPLYLVFALALALATIPVILLRLLA